MSILDHAKPYPVGWEPLFENNYHLLEHIQKVMEMQGTGFYPPPEDVFKAYRLCHPNKVKVFICGQDPYHGEDEANGLAFSVNPGTRIPPSLRNIFKVIKSTTGKDSICANNGDLTQWAKQGVFLLNASLTVPPDTPGGFKNIWDGWIQRTLSFLFKVADNNAFQDIYEDDDDGSESSKRFAPISLLWGRNAQKFKTYVSGPVLETSHPSPFSYARGFSESNHFNETNKILRARDIAPIIW